MSAKPNSEKELPKNPKNMKAPQTMVIRSVSLGSGKVLGQPVCITAFLKRVHQGGAENTISELYGSPAAVKVQNGQLEKEDGKGSPVSFRIPRQGQNGILKGTITVMIDFNAVHPERSDPRSSRNLTMEGHVEFFTNEYSYLSSPSKQIISLVPSGQMDMNAFYFGGHRGGMFAELVVEFPEERKKVRFLRRVAFIPAHHAVVERETEEDEDLPFCSKNIVVSPPAMKKAKIIASTAGNKNPVPLPQTSVVQKKTTGTSLANQKPADKKLDTPVALFAVVKVATISAAKFDKSEKQLYYRITFADGRTPMWVLEKHIVQTQDSAKILVDFKANSKSYKVAKYREAVASLRK